MSDVQITLELGKLQNPQFQASEGERDTDLDILSQKEQNS